MPTETPAVPSDSPAVVTGMPTTYHFECAGASSGRFEPGTLRMVRVEQVQPDGTIRRSTPEAEGVTNEAAITFNQSADWDCRIKQL